MVAAEKIGRIGPLKSYHLMDDKIIISGLISGVTRAYFEAVLVKHLLTANASNHI